MIDYNYSIGFVTGVSIGLFSGYFLKGQMLHKFFNTTHKSSIKGVLAKIKKMCESTKLVLVVRDDLKMGKGKIAAQCSHASVMAYRKSKKATPDILEQWNSTGQMKVVVKCDNEETLFDLKKKAETKGLLTSLVCDAGHTQVAPFTHTVLAIGPDSKHDLDQITGHLKLL